jgi:hypothetical protein
MRGGGPASKFGGIPPGLTAGGKNTIRRGFGLNWPIAVGLLFFPMGSAARRRFNTLGG